MLCSGEATECRKLSGRRGTESGRGEDPPKRHATLDHASPGRLDFGDDSRGGLASNLIVVITYREHACGCTISAGGISPATINSATRRGYVLPATESRRRKFN